MAVTFACEKCHAEYTVADSLAGKKGRCNSCGHLMQVPGGTRRPSAGSTVGGRSINLADPLASESRDMPARAPRQPGRAPVGKSRTDDPNDPLAALEAAAGDDDGTIPFTEEFQSRRTVGPNLGGAASHVCIILGVVACLLPLLNQPVINAYGRLPVYTGLGLGLLGAFLLIQKGRGNAGVVAGAVTVAAFFGGALYKPSAPSLDEPVARNPAPRALNNRASVLPNDAATASPMSPAFRTQLTNLNSFDAAARLAAAQELIKDPPRDRLAEVARAMEPKLSEQDPTLRLLAIEGVMLQPTAHSAGVLAPLAQDPDRAVRQRALRALGQLPGFTSAQAIVSRLADDPAAARDALAAAEVENPQAVTDAFKQLLDYSRDARLRAIAIDELAGRGASDMAEPFTTLIADPNPRVRDAAILALGRLRAASAIAVIADQLGATDAAVTALQSFGPAAEKDALMLAGSPNKLVRAAAAQVLITAATPQNLELVQRLAADEDRAVAAAALQAWKRLVPADFTPLQEALRDLASSDVLRQHAAIEKLTVLEPDEHRSKVAMHLVVVALGDNADLRLPAAKALESWGTRDALLVLVQALGDYDALKRERAKEMLGYLKDPSAIDPITDLAEKGNTTAVETLAAMGPIAEEGALRLLNCENSAIQLAAVRALGDIGTRRSVLPLGALMRSRPNHLARQEEREALRKINLRITDQAREEARRKIRTVPTTAPTAGQD